MLKEGYKAVKKGNSRAKVLFSGLSYVDSEFLDYCLDQNISSYIDIMNIHWYSLPNGLPEELIYYLERLKMKMDKRNLSKPLWISEVGFSTAQGYLSEEEQSVRVPRVFLISFALGVDKVFWYKSRSCEIRQDDKEDHFGLWHKDYSVKPAYHAYQTLTKMCPNKSSRPRLERYGSVYLASWKRPDKKKVWSIWTTKDESDVSLSISNDYDAFDGYGKKIEINDSKVFKVTPFLTYIVGAKQVLLKQ